MLHNEVIKLLQTRIKRPSRFPSIIAEAPRHNYQIDIMHYERKEYNGYKYILSVIDVYSRFAMCYPLRSKRMNEVTEALDKIFRVMGAPRNINADQEFNTHAANTLFRQWGVKKVYFSQPYDRTHNAIVERFHRTLAGLLLKWMVLMKTQDWPSLLPDVVAKYNTSYHSRIQARPVDVFLGVDINHQDIQYPDDLVFKVGDFVIANKLPIERPKAFKKSDSELNKIFTIRSIEGQRIFVRNLDGSEVRGYFKPYEIKKVPESLVGPLLHYIYHP